MNLQTKNRCEKTNNDWVMKVIACTVTGSVIIATIGIALYCILTERLEFVGQTLLPLWSTWFGTILAFYFSKQNIDAANKSNETLLNKLSERDMQFASKSVSTVMKHFDQIMTLNIEEDSEKSLPEIIENETFQSYNRFPIFSNKKDRILEYMVHRLVILKFLYNEENRSKTLNQFLTEMKIQMELKNSIGFVTETATLLDVKNEMDKHKNCKDVFVTKDGKGSSEVIGWITDNDIYTYGKV